MGFFSSIGKVFKSVAAPLTGGLLSFAGGERANSATAASTQAQMDFQREMRDTSYQAAMKDMRTAGMNPIMAYKMGGAHTPGGSSAVLNNSVASGVDAFNSVNNSAISMRKTSPELKKLREEVDNLTSRTELNYEQKWKTATEHANARKQGLILEAQKKGVDLDNTAKSIANKIQAVDAVQRMTKGKFKGDHPNLQKIEAITETLGKFFGAGANAAKAIK